MSDERNPQAFPVPLCVGPNDDLYPAYPGMTLRDWFAGQTVAGLVRDYTMPENIAREAYAIADAMLAQRGRQP